MSPSDLLTLISRTNKVSIIFFVITGILLIYEFYLYTKDRKGLKKPSIPLFKKGNKNEPLTVHPAKPMPLPPSHPTMQTKPAAAMPPLIAQMKPPVMSHGPGAASPSPRPNPMVKPGGVKKKKKMSRGAKVTIGATVALAVLTIGIAIKMNQPASQEASLTSTHSRAAEPNTTPVAATPGAESVPVDTTPHKTIPILQQSAVSPSPVPTGAIDLTAGSPSSTTDFASGSGSLTPSASSSATTDGSTSTSSSVLTQLPVTGGNASPTATLAPTLPIAGTVQYSFGLLALASAIVIASLIF